MKLIVGLGNPGQEYINTRHNLGYLILDRLASELAILKFANSPKFIGQITETSKSNQKIILFKPSTFMNNSGQAVGLVANFYKISAEDIWIVHDELALEFGQMRIRKGGGSAGHNGIKSISQAIGEDYIRFRVGIHNKFSSKVTSEKFVLSQFTDIEKKHLDTICSQVAEKIIDGINGEPKHTSYQLID